MRRNRKTAEELIKDLAIILMSIGIFVVVGFLANWAEAQDYSENTLNDAYCDFLDGEREVRAYYDYGDTTGYVVIDCLTDVFAVEGGRDTRSSLDSVQQAIFAAYITGTYPVVVIYDTDGELGAYEYRIGLAATSIGLNFAVVNAKELLNAVSN